MQVMECQKKQNKRSIYKELKQIYLGNIEEYKTSHPDLLDRFDYIIASGVLADFHASSDILLEMNASLKSGGIIIITTRQAYMNELGYQAIIDKFIENNEWKDLGKHEYEKFRKSSDAKIGDWKPIPAIRLTFKKL